MKSNVLNRLLITSITTCLLVGCGNVTTESGTQEESVVETENVSEVEGDKEESVSEAEEDVDAEEAEEDVDAEEVEEDIDAEEVEEGVVETPYLKALEQYDSYISTLEPGQAYAFADICFLPEEEQDYYDIYDVLLVSKDGAIDDGNGNMVAINAEIIGLDTHDPDHIYPVIVGEANGGSTAYPLAVYDGCLVVANNSSVIVEKVYARNHLLTVFKSATVDYLGGSARYFYFDHDVDNGGNSRVDDDSKINELYELYDKATVINFTVVE